MHFAAHRCLSYITLGILGADKPIYVDEKSYRLQFWTVDFDIVLYLNVVSRTTLCLLIRASSYDYIACDGPRQTENYFLKVR